MEVSVQIHAPAAFFEGKISHYPLNRKLDVLQNQSGRFKERSNLLSLPGIEYRSQRNTQEP